MGIPMRTTSAAALLAGALVLEYGVLLDGEPAGTSRAVVEDLPDGRSLEIETSVAAKVMGLSVEMTSSVHVRYDAEGRATSFDMSYTRPTGDTRVRGERRGSGYDVVLVEGGKQRKVRIEDASYDRVSVEKGLWAGEVGSKIKARVFFAGEGEVRKATIRILDREERTVLGAKTLVTHFTIKSGLGSVEEWRTGDAVIVESRVSTPVGKVRIVLDEGGV
jgi:hypothetical protein